MDLRKRVVGCVLLLQIVGTLQAQRPNLDQGAVGLALALRRLPVTASFLHTTAHPDDEDNPLLVMMRRGRGVRAGLLTLTRGDGGQNEIGPELFQALGIIRTEELMAMHRYDDVEQFFTRAYEFGYSFSVEETIQRWGEEEVLADMVRVIRTFRPQVVQSLPRGGEGGGQHHQASALLAEKAFHAAADPNRFPEQLKEGLRPWQARKLYERFRWLGGRSNRDATIPAHVLKISTGGYDPILGKTYAQLGSESRAMHKCQGMTQIIPLRRDYFSLWNRISPEHAEGVGESDMFDGIDTGLTAIAEYAQGQLEQAPFLIGSLRSIQSSIDQAQRAFSFDDPGLTAPFVARGLDFVRSLQDRIRASRLDESARYEILFLLRHKERDFVDALNLANQLTLEAIVQDGRITPGQEFDLQLVASNGSSQPVTLERIEFVSSEGWETVAAPAGVDSELSSGALRSFDATLRASEDSAVTEPYWSGPMDKADRYLIKGASAAPPWERAPLSVRLHYRSYGVESAVQVNAEFRYTGKWVGGEQRHDVMVVPDVSVSVDPGIILLPLHSVSSGRELRVTVLNERKGGLSGSVSLRLPEKWRSSPDRHDYTFSREGESVTRIFMLYPDRNVGEGSFQVDAVGSFGGREYRRGYQVIDYDHTQRRHLYHPSSVEIRTADVRVKRGLRVGYVVGVGDYVPEALQQLGIDFETLGEDTLAFSDLSRFDTIITGVRAYLVREDLKASNHRLLDWVQAGGTLIVQYNKYEFNGPGQGRRGSQPSPYAPYPLLVSNGRVTDESAPIRILERQHPVFRTPNRIGAADWEDWVQERGLYFLGEKDERYVDLLSTQDPFPFNAGEKRGALVEARYGKGRWIYLGLGLWRELPAGVPGSYRLLANLVSLGR